MADLEELFLKRVKAKDEARQAEIDKYIKIRDERLELCKRFFEQISFLNNYGFRWEIRSYCNNGSDCCMPRYAWIVGIVNHTIATSPFESFLQVKEINGELRARFSPTILGKGRFVKGQDKEGYFTAEQFIIAFS